MLTFPIRQVKICDKKAKMPFLSKSCWDGDQSIRWGLYYRSNLPNVMVDVSVWYWTPMSRSSMSFLLWWLANDIGQELSWCGQADNFLIVFYISYVMFQVLIPFPSLNQNVKHMLSTNSKCDLTELIIWWQTVSNLTFSYVSFFTFLTHKGVLMMLFYLSIPT